MEKAKKVPFGFSWADEVEREEREEEQNAARGAFVDAETSRKPNPFGAARPREVVLEEKGVDWRKLDRDLDHSSNLRKEKKLKENVSTVNALVNRHEHFPLRQSYLVGSNTQNARVSDQTIAHYVHPAHQKQDISTLVPPLRYPPKNIIARMEEIRRGCHIESLDAVQENLHQDRYPCNFNVEREREHVNDKRREMRLHAHELMGSCPMEVPIHNAATRAYLDPNVESGHVRVSPNFEIRNAAKDVEFKCDRRKHLGDKFLGSTEQMHPIGGRQVLADMNGQRTIHSESHMGGEGDYWGCMQDGGRRRKYVQENLMGPPVEPHGWAFNHQSCGTERGYSGDQDKDRGLGLTTGVNEYGRRNNERELVGHLAMVVESRGRTRKDQHRSKTGAKETADNHKKKREMPSEANPGPSRKQRQRKRARKRKVFEKVSVLLS